MDNLTHSLVGALIGQAGLKRKTGLAMPALIIGANLPDVDAACFLWLEGVEHLAFRRGITHGPIAWVLLPLLLAAGLWWWDRWQARRGQGRFRRPEGRLPVHFGWLYGLAFLACLTHPALDWLNVYGIRLLEPFSSQWFYGDVLFIVDIWLWAVLGVGTWLSLRREKRGSEWRKPARIAMAVGLAYIGVNAVISKVAESRGLSNADEYPRVVIAAPVPFLFWERESLVLLDYENWAWVSSKWTGKPLTAELNFPEEVQCRLPGFWDFDLDDREQEAFRTWSRAPLAVRAPDGSVLIRDARFYEPLARDRFTVALPDVRCEPIPSSARPEPVEGRERGASGLRKLSPSVEG